MQKYLMIVLFLLGCSQISQISSETTWEKEGIINFMYIKIPCEECINLIEEILSLNENVFSYDITKNNVNENIFVLINYCYNYNATSSTIIEESVVEKGFSINGMIPEEQKIILEERLRSRGNDQTTQIKNRLKRFEKEMESKENFDLHYVNENLEETINLINEDIRKRV